MQRTENTRHVSVATSGPCPGLLGTACSMKLSQLLFAVSYSPFLPGSSKVRFSSAESVWQL